MPTVHVTGVGDIDLPDGLSKDEMAEAIHSHPDVQAYTNSENPLHGANEGLNNFFGPINSWLSKNTPLDTSEKVQNEVVKGIPVAGALAQDDTAHKQFEQDHPIVSKAANIAGGTAAMLPLTAGVGALAGGNTILNAVGQSGLGAATNFADATAKGESEQDRKNQTLLGLLAGPASAVGGKALSPGINLSDNLAKTLAAVGGAGAGLYATMKGGLAHGLEPVLGLLMGETPLAPKLLQKTLGNTALSNPTSQALLSAMAQSAPASIPNGPQVPNGD